MELTKDNIDSIAKLARLQFRDEETDQIKSDLQKILVFMDKLSEVDTEGVEPLVYINDDVNVLREDVSQHSITHEEALKNAPLKDSDYIKVTKVLQKDQE